MKKIFVIVNIIISAAFVANGQPNIQKVSVRAPENIKIDGQLPEWNDKLQARNPIDGIKYTVSNNNENLYLTIIAPYKDAARKVLRGGITFSISKQVDKRRKNDPAKRNITFPLVEVSRYSTLLSDFSNYYDIEKNNKTRADSILMVINQKASILFRSIRIDEDKIIPAKNDIGIIAQAHYNNKLDFVYELCIPLKYLGLDASYSAPFSYNICLNGLKETRKINNSPEAQPIFPAGYIAPVGLDNVFLSTDFWGEYTLAK